jgi:probable F420-dependent oxidoreductase
MDFGAAFFATDYSIDVVELARALEERGFESLFLAEHTHIPVSRRSPWPGGPELPRHYWHTLDPFVALAAAAAVTSRLRLGTGICLVVERDPIITAKEVASLDLLSGGRVLFGVGAGWNREEMENHGTDFATRFQLMRQRVLAMKEIWTREEAEFHGELVDFDPIWSWPKPVQQPHPPVLVGGSGERALRRVVDYGDGWMPIPGRGSIVERIPELQELAAAAGRPPLPVTIYGAAPDPAALEHYRAAGIARCIFSVPSVTRDEALPELDRLAELVGRFT